MPWAYPFLVYSSSLLDWTWDSGPIQHFQTAILDA